IGFGFNGAGELLRIFNDVNQIIDSVTYDDNLPWPIEPDGNGATLELLDFNSDNSLAENWKASEGNGTPGKMNSGLVSIDDKEIIDIPNSYQLFQNYPNPFNPSTTIKFAVPKQSKVAIKIFDVLGNEIKTLHEGIKQTGTHLINFNAGNLSSGVYFYKLQYGNSQLIKKLILLK
ncbi:MAG: T9SS type A sorting domain-containing protein, partial [Ignavibacteriae bacterium]|nr:T9SS type A sorting domain-containing protein [Ignavibacteriota bacterium]